MFKARLKPSEQGTLERRYEFHLGEATRAALLGDHEKAAGHSRTALAISRALYGGARDPAPQRPGLAAALASHAPYQRDLDSLALLTESAGHYAALAGADPPRYEVERIDVLTRVALAAEAAGSTRDAIRLLREVIDMYRKAPAEDAAARDAGLARASFHLGRCLLTAGEVAEGLAVTDAGLSAAEAALSDWLLPDGHACCRPTVLSQAAVPPQAAAPPMTPVPSRTSWLDQGWLPEVPLFIQVIVPDWVAAAVRAMTLHAAAGQWPAAAAAAAAAVRLSGGLAALGGEDSRQEHASIIARAQPIWAHARSASGRPAWA